MLTHYWNAAILHVREAVNGVDKLQRLEGETTYSYNKRRAEYIRNKKARKTNRRK